MGRLFDKLTANEKKMMKFYIDNYAVNDCDSGRSASLDYILRFWDEEKAPLYDMLGGMIISKEVTFEKGIDEIADHLNRTIFYGGADYDFIMNIRNKVFNTMLDSQASAEALGCTKHNVLSFRDCLGAYGLAKNVFEDASFEINNPKDPDHKIKIAHGGKITRVLSKVAEAYDIEGFEHFRITHSQCLNQKKLHGNLCLSIHPLDYMTMSDNNCGWTSCMSWKDYGCYRQGTVEMMNSPMVVVAYLTAEDEMRIGYRSDNNPWNSKKWRQLFIVQKDLIANVKAYPYRNDSLTKEVLGWLKELAEKAGIGKYEDEITNYDAYNDFIHNGKTIRISPETGYMYNDFNDDQFAYLAEGFADRVGGERWNTYYYNYSGTCECMACGETDCEFDGEGNLVGDCCDGEYYYCAECGERIYEGDQYEVDGEYYCEYCYKEHCMEDPISQEEHIDYHMVEVRLVPNGSDEAIWEHTIHLYPDDHTKDELAKYFTVMRRIGKRYMEPEIYVRPEDCTEEGLALFEDYDPEASDEDNFGKINTHFAESCEDGDAWDLTEDLKNTNFREFSYRHIWRGNDEIEFTKTMDSFQYRRGYIRLV